ncbi:unnamed protein product, partial [Brassica oleracea var. botrytis]
AGAETHSLWSGLSRSASTLLLRLPILLLPLSSASVPSTQLFHCDSVPSSTQSLRAQLRINDPQRLSSLRRTAHLPSPPPLSSSGPHPGPNPSLPTGPSIKKLASLQSERQAAEDLRKAFSEAQSRNSELATELEMLQEKQISFMNRFKGSLEKKLSNSESEIQVLRQQALPISPTSRTMATPSKAMLFTRTPENGNLLNGETKTTPDMALAVREPESEEKPQKYLNEKQQTDLEEAKAQEFAKQQEALQAMWFQVEEGNAAVIREREAARKAIEEAPPVIKETPVLVEDTEKINSLASEVEALKASLQYERKAAEDLRKAFSEAEARNSELATELENATRKADQLHESASLQSERQAAEDLRKAFSEAEARNSELATELENATRKADQLHESENQDLLVKCISQNLGYAGGKPVAACVIYKSLLHWRSFEVERTNVFDRIIQTIASAIEVPDNNEVLAYWLSNSATLLLLLQRTLKATGAATGLSFLNRQGVTKLDDLRQVEAKYPALLFKQQLTAFLEKIYGMIRDNLKKEISPLLGLCIQVTFLLYLCSYTLIAHWQSIRKSLNAYLNLMKANNVSLDFH